MAELREWEAANGPIDTSATADAAPPAAAGGAPGTGSTADPNAGDFKLDDL